MIGADTWNQHLELLHIRLGHFLDCFSSSSLTIFFLCVHTCFQCSAEISCKWWNRTLNKTRNKDLYTTFLFSLLHVANLMNMKPSSCSSECFGLWVSANCFYFLNESRGYQGSDHKRNDRFTETTLQPHFIIQLFTLCSLLWLQQSLSRN